MKLLFAVLGSLLVVSLTQATDVCYKGGEPGADCRVATTCSSKLSTKIPNADLSYFTKLNFQKSFKYLLFAMNYNNYQRDRPGFNKIFRQQSDKLFDNSIKLIKQLTTRGYNVDFKYSGDQRAEYPQLASEVLGTLPELEAVAKALDIEKHLAELSLNIAHTAGSARSPDAELQHFMQEEFLEDQVKTVRKFTGYFNDLQRFYGDGNVNSYPLAVYLFDQYLQKQ